MRNDLLIRNLIRNSSRRAGREIFACLLILVFFGGRLPHLAAGSLRQYGCIVILVAAVVISAVVWMFTLSEKLLREHPARDIAFWSRVFQRQARLLRLVPLWYLAPLALGIVLFSFPTSPRQMTGFYLNLALLVLSFAFLTWLNRTAALGLEKQEREIAST